MPPERNNSIPCWQAWLAAGLFALSAGTWLLRLDDPFLLTLWGVGLLVIGAALSIVGAGMGLRLWR